MKECCCNIFTVVIVAIAAYVITLSPADDLPTSKTSYKSETCYKFTKDYLDVNDVYTIAVVCTRLALLMEAGLDQRTYFVIPKEELHIMCDTLIGHDPHTIPHEFEKYAYLTFKHICNHTLE